MIADGVESVNSVCSQTGSMENFGGTLGIAPLKDARLGLNFISWNIPPRSVLRSQERYVVSQVLIDSDLRNAFLGAMPRPPKFYLPRPRRVARWFPLCFHSSNRI